FGRQPTAFRAGRFGIGPATLGFLHQLGYRADSSVTPGLAWTPQLSFRGAPTQPYWPDATAPEKPGQAAVLEIPVTIRPAALGRLPLVGRWIEPRWLRPTWSSAAALLRLAAEEIRAARSAQPGRPVLLNAMFHNVEIIPAASPYARSERRARTILRR